MARIIQWDLGENSISLLLLFKGEFGFEMSTREVCMNHRGPNKDGNQRN